MKDEYSEIVKDIELNISSISENMKNIEIFGRVREVNDIRSFKRDNNEIGHVGSFVLYDTTGEIRIILWDDQVNVLKDSRFGKNGLVKIVNAYAKVGRSEDLELHVGKLGNVILSPDDVDSSKYPILKDKPIQIGNIDLTRKSILVEGQIKQKYPIKEFTRKDGATGMVGSLILR